MNLQRAIFHNYKQHRDLTIEFKGSVIAIIGANGHGKSNLIGGIQFCLTGEQPGFNKEELTTWGEDDGFVTCEFEHDGVDWSCTRHTGTTKATLKGSNNESFTGVKSVNAALAEKFGLDTDVAKQSIFVNQGDIDNVLFTGPRERELSFQKLVGIGHAQKLHDVITKFINELAQPVDYDTLASEHMVRSSQAHTTLLSVERTLADAQLKLSELGTRAEVMANITELNKVSAAKLHDKMLADSIVQAQRNLDIYRTQIQIVPNEVADIARFNELQTVINNASKNLEQLYLMKNAWIDYDRVQNSLTSALAAEENLDSEAETRLQFEIEHELEPALTAARKARSEVDAELKLHNQLQSALSGTGYAAKCPLCKSELTNTNLAKEQLQTVSALKQQLLSLQAEEARQLANFNHAVARKQNLARMRDLVQSQLATAKANIAAVVKPQFEKDIIDQGLVALNAEKELATKELGQLQNSIALRTKIIASNKSITDSITATELNLVSMITNSNDYKLQQGQWVDMTETQVQQAIALLNKALADINSVMSVMNTAQGQITALKQQISEHEQALAEIYAKRDAQRKLVAVRETLTNVKYWFHYENGPHAVTSTVMKELTPNVNFFLYKLSAPFGVNPDLDSVGFRYQMLDGTEMPDPLPTAKALSGAQKDMLAMSFRLASYTMFAAKLGILVLDEPTAHLDVDNVGKFGELLIGIQKIAADLNLQIIIVTHHSEILPFCDSTIDLGR